MQRSPEFAGGNDALEQFFFGGALTDCFDGGLRKSCRREPRCENTVKKGLFLPASRFVNPLTGQMTDLLPLPEIIVS